MSTPPTSTTNGAHVAFYHACPDETCRCFEPVTWPALDPDPLYVAPDPEPERLVSVGEFRFGLAVLLVFVAVVAWIATRGA